MSQTPHHPPQGPGGITWPGWLRVLFPALNPTYKVPQAPTDSPSLETILEVGLAFEANFLMTIVAVILWVVETRP
jgi:hypothetical protein